MLKHWSTMLSPGEEVHAYLREPIPPESIAHLNLSSAIKFEIVPPKMQGIVWENFPMALRARKTADVLFGPAYTLPLLSRKPRKRVVATHSVNQVESGAHDFWYNYTYAKRDELCARSADAVIVPCDTAADLVAKQYGVPRKRLFSVPQGAPHSFRPLENPELLRQTRIAFLGTDAPYILFVGKLSSRRNIPNLIGGFAKAKKAKGLPHKLLLVGPNHVHLPLAEVCREHGVTADVVQTDGKFTDHEELIPLYNAADVFIQPSIFEGWSITTVEALACGTAVIASNRGGLIDVAHGHAYMLEDPSVETIADALEKVLLDDYLRQELKQLARARGKTFTWERTTGETLDVIRQVARS
ncbi:MAG: glycosyltransferase family 4 protein [Chthoniobacterales bacterium]|nr:glycosyltransferase family 4 protein [Chthoniobacterales bacterium]